MTRPHPVPQHRRGGCPCGWHIGGKRCKGVRHEGDAQTEGGQRTVRWLGSQSEAAGPCLASGGERRDEVGAENGSQPRGGACAPGKDV